MKNLLFGITLGVLILAILYGGMHLLGRQIYNTQSCDRFNIDNIELRTGIDIPKVSAIDCKCENNTKVSKFIIDTEKVDLDKYVQNNDFKLVDQLYIKENNTKNSTYKVIFNKETAELTVDLTYKDK